MQIHQFLPTAACAALSGIKPTPELHRQWGLVMADYHQLVGEYEEARHRYAELLARDATDGEARLSLARLLQYIQEYEKGKAEYAKVPPAGNRGRQARQGIADTLYDQRRYPESAECCEKLLAENPADGDAMARQSVLEDRRALDECYRRTGGQMLRIGSADLEQVPPQYYHAGRFD